MPTNLKEEIRTSDTHPLYVDFIEAEELKLPGRLGLTFAPGKKHLAPTGVQWLRDVDKDLEQLRRKYKTDVLVSLIEDWEFEHLGIISLKNRVSDFNIKFVLYPIPDMSVPCSIEEFADLVYEIAEVLRAGETVVIYCMGGLGRTGLVAASCLLYLACMKSHQAIKIVRCIREKAIQTHEQEEFIELFYQFVTLQMESNLDKIS